MFTRSTYTPSVVTGRRGASGSTPNRQTTTTALRGQKDKTMLHAEKKTTIAEKLDIKAALKKIKESGPLQAVYTDEPTTRRDLTILPKESLVKARTTFVREPAQEKKLAAKNSVEGREGAKTGAPRVKVKAKTKAPKKAAVKTKAPKKAAVKVKAVGVEAPKARKDEFRVTYVTSGSGEMCVEGSKYGEWKVEFLSTRMKKFRTVGVISMIHDSTIKTSGRAVVVGYKAFLKEGNKLTLTGETRIEDDARKLWRQAQKKAVNIIREAITA